MAPEEDMFDDPAYITDALAVTPQKEPGGLIGQPSNTAPDVREPPPGAVKFADLMTEHPSRDPVYWSRLRALYGGGRRLLSDRRLLRDIFPPHRDEHPSLYEERVRRAYYVSHPARLIGKVMAQLARSPIELKLKAEDKDTDPPEVPEDWKEFFEDCSPPGGRRQPLADLLIAQMREAQVVRVAWTLVDMPLANPEAFSNLGEQEAAGARRAYAVAIPAESVLDWREDASGELEWFVRHTVEVERAGIRARRDTCLQRWTVWDRKEWEIFEIRHPVDKPPKPDDYIPSVRQGVHPFGRVPVARLDLTDDFWSMDKLEGSARTLFNSSCALAWGEFQALYPELYEYLAPELASGIGGIPSEAQQDVERARRQRRGIGMVQERGSEDKAEYVGPSSEPFAQASSENKGYVSDMESLMHEMAISAPNSAEVLGRSGESKGFDRAAQQVLAAALAKFLREHAIDVADIACRGRQATALVGEWIASGADEFDEKGPSDAIAEATELVTINIPSPTFKRLHALNLAKIVLGPVASPSDLLTIESELEENISQEAELSLAEGAAGVATAVAEEATAGQVADEDGNVIPAKLGTISVSSKKKGKRP